MNKLLLAALLLTISTLPAHALSLKEKQKMMGWNVYLEEEHLAGFEEECGYALPVTLDEALAAPFLANHTHAGAYCGEAVTAMKNMCGDELSREAIAGRITALNCTYEEGNEEGGFEIDEEGVMTFTFGLGIPNINDKTKTYLENNL